MAIEKMVLLNLVGSLDDEHAILEELVLSENIHLNLEHNDVYDNHYMVHQYESMMPQDAFPIIENYAQMEAEYHGMLEAVEAIGKGMGITPKIDKVNVKRYIGFVSQFRMEIVFAIVYVNPFQNELYSETLCPDMLYNTLVFLVNGFQ